MLELKVHDGENEVVLKFEHSLLSLSKWESEHKKAFMASSQKTPTEMIEYFQAMLVAPEGQQDLVFMLEPEQLDSIANYINESRTASSVPKDGPSRSNEIVTSELIYFWMTQLKIPFEAETWHLSRLMMLVQIANFKLQPAKKQRTGELLSSFRAANEARKKQYGTTG